MAEGRLSRWSRLKQKGGADAREEDTVAEERVQKAEAIEKAEPDFAKLPGGVQVRNFVPAMAPLAPEPEDDDDRLTRGIGHIERAPDDAEGDAQEDEDATSAHEGEAIDDIEERELTEEEKEVVAGLPPLETLTEESDFTPYLQKGVPEFLKRRALRILWGSNPFFNFRDGLNDYDEDFNVVHKIIDEMTGAYQVGRGHLSEEELRDMMPEKARRAFDEDDEEELEEEAAETADGKADSTESDDVENDPEAAADDDDEIVDGDDDFAT